MSAYEWADIASSHLNNALATYAITLTLASAYLAAAFVAGNKLTRTQLTLINSVFVPAMLYNILTSMRTQIMYIDARNAAHELEPQLAVFPEYAIIPSLTISLLIPLAILFISIIFMLDIRKTKLD